MLFRSTQLEGGSLSPGTAGDTAVNKTARSRFVEIPRCVSNHGRDVSNYTRGAGGQRGATRSNKPGQDFLRKCHLRLEKRLLRKDTSHSYLP